MYRQETIASVEVKDVRFPTSRNADGSDAMHTDPDYSCAYVIIKPSGFAQHGRHGCGLTFTLGRGTEIVVKAVEALVPLVVAQTFGSILDDFATFWRKLTSESQMRWIGPEKGVMHLAACAILNALWDLWAKCENKPVWRLLVDLTPAQIVSLIDFRYITDVITRDEALRMLESAVVGQKERIELVTAKGYPAYTTQVGWLGYSDEKIATLARKYLALGFTQFKIKVGQNLRDDIRRCEAIRAIIGYDNTLMVDANQVWDVQEAIDWMKQLARFKPLWIEEPTSPDDVVGHKNISDALKPYGIAVASGEMCCNRVLFKQFLQLNAIQYCQIDSGRIGSINEILSVYLMARKLNIPVCPHAGGVGLCEMVQHLQVWDYVALSTTMDNRVIEYVDQQHDQFVDPVVVEGARYRVPTAPGYSTQLKAEAIERYEFPGGREWKGE